LKPEKSRCGHFDLSTIGAKLFSKKLLENFPARDDKLIEVSTLFEQKNFPALFVIRNNP